MRRSNIFFLVGIVALILLTIACSAGAYAVARQFAVDLGESGIQIVSFADFAQAQPTREPTQTPEPTATLRPDETPLPTLTPSPEATVDPLAQYTWEDPRSINILLLGIDQRRGEEDFFRTDTIMIASIDPVRRTVGLLSIPRDLWVNIPGYQPQRINNANALGDSGAYPGGGPALAARTISENLGINIDKYIRINFDVFDAIVNLIAPNGIEVCPQEVIDDPDYPDDGYGYIHVHFDAGCQTLDAVRLLQYARTRATEGADFDRAERQQEVLKALQTELLSLGGIGNLITQAPALWEQLSGAYITNLTLQEILSLGALAMEIPSENIRTGTIGPRQVQFATMAGGEQVLQPNYIAINQLMQEVFSGRPVVSGEVNEESAVEMGLSLAELRSRAEAEGATIAVFNNANISGLAGQTRDWLLSRQIQVAEIGNIPNADASNTLIRDYNNNPYTGMLVAQLLGLPPEVVISTPPDGLTSADIMVVVGPDIQSVLQGN